MPIGFDLAIRYPDRLLSLIIGGAEASRSQPNVAWAELLEQDGVQAFLDSVESAMSPFPAPVHERMLTTADPEALAAATLVDRPSLEADIGAINLPALVYCGDKDPAYDGARQAAEVVPHARFVSLAGFNHDMRQVWPDVARTRDAANRVAVDAGSTRISGAKRCCRAFAFFSLDSSCRLCDSRRRCHVGTGSGSRSLSTNGAPSTSRTPCSGVVTGPRRKFLARRAELVSWPMEVVDRGTNDVLLTWRGSKKLPR